MKKQLNIIWLVALALCVNLPAFGQVLEKGDLAKPLLDIISQNQPENRYKYYFYEGVSQKSLGNSDAAFELFSHCLSLDSNRVEAYYELGSLQMTMKNYPLAIQHFSKATELDSLNYWYNEAYFFALYSQPEMNNEAIGQLERMSNRFPDKLPIQFQLLELYNQSNEYDRLVSLLNKLEEKLGKSEQFSMQKFSAYIDMGDERSAFNEIEKLVSAYPNDVRYQVIMANLYISLDKFKPAGKLLDKVLKAEPDNPLALFTLAEYYDKTGQEEKYLNQIRKVILDPNQGTELRLNLIRQYIVKVESDSKVVIPLFEEAMIAMPEDDQVPLLYTQFLYSINEQPKAKPALERVLEIDASNTAARLMLLGLAVRENDYLAVIEICKEGVIASPQTLEFHYYLAIAYNQAKEPNLVLSTIDKALQYVDESTPSDLTSDFYAIQGDVYHELGDYKKLYESYDKALSYSSSNLGVLNNYAYYLSVQRKDLNKAEVMSKKTVDAEPKNATFLDTYAWILFELKRYAEAKIYIEQALENGGDVSGVIIEHAGDVYYMLGEKEKAMELWLKADTLDGGGPKLKQKIKRGKFIQ